MVGLQMTLPKYVKSPATKICSYLSQQVVTSKITKQLPKAYLTPGIRSYMVEKIQGWQNTPDTSWWYVYGKAIKSLNYSEKTLKQKFSNNWWLTHHCDHICSSFIENQCDECKMNKKDEDHIVKCNSDKRMEIRDAWYGTRS